MKRSTVSWPVAGTMVLEAATTMPPGGRSLVLLPAHRRPIDTRISAKFRKLFSVPLGAGFVLPRGAAKGGRSNLWGFSCLHRRGGDLFLRAGYGKTFYFRWAGLALSAASEKTSRNSGGG